MNVSVIKLTLSIRPGICLEDLFLVMITYCLYLFHISRLGNRNRIGILGMKQVNGNRMRALVSYLDDHYSLFKLLILLFIIHFCYFKNVDD